MQHNPYRKLKVLIESIDMSLRKINVGNYLPLDIPAQVVLWIQFIACESIAKERPSILVPIFNLKILRTKLLDEFAKQQCTTSEDNR